MRAIPRRSGTTVTSFRPRADARRTRQPDLPVRRRRRLEHADLGGLARAVLVFRGPAEEAGGAGAGGASDGATGPTASCRWSSTSSWAPASRCSTRSTIPGAGDFARATGISAGSGCRRSGFWRGRGWSASGRPRSRPTAADISAVSRSSFASGSRTRGWRPRRVT